MKNVQYRIKQGECRKVASTMCKFHHQVYKSRATNALLPVVSLYDNTRLVFDIFLGEKMSSGFVLGAFMFLEGRCNTNLALFFTLDCSQPLLKIARVILNHAVRRENDLKRAIPRCKNVLKFQI